MVRWKINGQWVAFWLGAIVGLLIVVGCEVSNIYVKGNNNVIMEEQKEDIKIDSLKINSNLINK